MAGKDLRSQAIAANTFSFVRTLLSEGFSVDDVEPLMMLFVRQLRATGTKVPSGGAYDLVAMALTDERARQGPLMSEEHAELLELQKGPPLMDDFDVFDLEADLSE